MIWVTDPDKKFNFVNRAWFEFKDSNLDQAINSNLEDDKIHPKDKERILKVYDNSFENKKVFRVQFQLERNGVYDTILSQGKPDCSHEIILPFS